MIVAHFRDRTKKYIFYFFIVKRYHANIQHGNNRMKNIIFMVKVMTKKRKKNCCTRITHTMYLRISFRFSHLLLFLVHTIHITHLLVPPAT